MKTKKLWDALGKRRKKKIIYTSITIVIILFFVWPLSFPTLGTEEMPSVAIRASRVDRGEEHFRLVYLGGIVTRRDSEIGVLVNELLSEHTFRRSPVHFFGNIYRSLSMFFTNTSGWTTSETARYQIGLTGGPINHRIIFFGDGRILVNNSFHRMNRNAENEVINEILAILGYYNGRVQ